MKIIRYGAVVLVVAAVGIFLQNDAAVVAPSAVSSEVVDSVVTTQNEVAPVTTPEVENRDAVIDTSVATSDVINGSVAVSDDSASSSTKPVAAAGVFEAYSPEKIAQAAQGDVVLFFHASWCPTCRVVAADIRENATSIPSGVTILQVNYDTERDLIRKYGVTYQHTFVQVDADGTLIHKWQGGSTLDSVIAQIK